ncbi:hypothetical protein [Streptomyces sp. NPDC001508]
MMTSSSTTLGLVSGDAPGWFTKVEDSLCRTGFVGDDTAVTTG